MSNKRNELILIVLLCIVVAIFVTSTFYEDFFIIPTVYEESRDEDGKATFSFRFRFKSEPVEEVAPDRYTIVLSEETRDMLLLFLELYSFKDDKDFLEVGFDSCCKYNNWLNKLIELEKNTDVEKIFSEIGFDTKDLNRLALDYLFHGQASSIDTQRIERMLLHTTNLLIIWN